MRPEGAEERSDETPPGVMTDGATRLADVEAQTVRRYRPGVEP